MALTDRDKRTLKIGGIIIGVMLVGFLLYSLLGGGGGGGEELVLPSTPGQPSGPSRADDVGHADARALARAGAARPGPVLDPTWL